MKIRNVVGDVIAEVEITPTEQMLVGGAACSEDAMLVWIRIFRKVYEAGVAAGRAYDPRTESPRDPMGLVGPSDAETIGHPWCPWCRERSHFGACKSDLDLVNDEIGRRIRKAKP